MSMEIIYIIIIVLIIGAVVFLLRKFIPGLKDEEEKDEARQVEEEVNRMIVNPEPEKENKEEDEDEKE